MKNYVSYFRHLVTGNIWKFYGKAINLPEAVSQAISNANGYDVLEYTGETIEDN